MVSFAQNNSHFFAALVLNTSRVRTSDHNENYDSLISSTSVARNNDMWSAEALCLDFADSGLQTVDQTPPQAVSSQTKTFVHNPIVSTRTSSTTTVTTRSVHIRKMPKSSIPPSLNLSAAKSTTQSDSLQHLSPSTLSPRSSRSPRSNPGSPYLQEGFEHTAGQNGTDNTGKGETANSGSISPSITAIPPYPPSPPKTSPKHGRDPSRSFFSNLMASKSSNRLQSFDQSATETGDRGRTSGRGRASSKDRVLYSSRGKDSTSDLLKSVKSSEIQRDHSADRKMSGSDTSSQPLEGAASQSAPTKKTKQRFGLLNRSRSIKTDDQSRPKPSAPQRLDLSSPTATSNRDPQFSQPMKTAPLRNDHRKRAFDDAIGSSHRNRSADRPPVPGERSLESFPPRNNRPGGSLATSNSFKDGTGTQLLSNLHQTGRGAADRLGKAGKGFLGRITRSGSNHERELVTDDNYTCSSINLPLVRQTRRTRIAKRMELSKDKTEFWMPALPWRCIE